MSALLRAVEVLVFITNLWLVFSVFFFLFLSFWGFGKQQLYGKHAPATRFLVFIPACNEEKVIEDALRSIQNAAYPPELVDICVIADNCTDRTAEISERCGAKVFHTAAKPGEPVGKPHAIKRVLDRYPEFYGLYDLLVILDADNLITGNFFSELNSQYIDCGKPAAIQVYPGCKNRKGLVTFFYYHMYTVNNRFFQLSKSRLHINNALCGTGMALSLRALNDMGGWNANSLTEDMELQIKLTLRGERILWNHEARIYDEKPLRASTSFRQRTRWAQGHWYVALHNAAPLFRAYLSGAIPLKELVSSMIFVFSMPLAIQLPLLGLELILFLLIGPSQAVFFMRFGSDPWWSVIMALPLLYGLFVLFLIADRRDNRQPFRLSTLWWVTVSYLTAYPLGLAAQLLGLCKHRNQSVWAKTEHEINVADTRAASVHQAEILDLCAEQEPPEVSNAPDPPERVRSIQVTRPQVNRPKERSVV